MGRKGALGAGVGFVVAMALGALIVVHLPFTAVGAAASFAVGLIFGLTGLVAGMLIGRHFD